MCTSTLLVADALPVHPEIVIPLSTVERSGIGTSVPFVPEHAGAPPPTRFSVQLLRNPTSNRAAPCTPSRHVPLPTSLDRSTVYTCSIFSALPPQRLCSTYTEPSGATSVTTRSPWYVC